METFQILHLAACWPRESMPVESVSPPLATRAVSPAILEGHPGSAQSPPQGQASKELVPRARIRAAAAQIVFAARHSREFITPEQVEDIENWCGRGVLDALATFEIAPEVRERDNFFCWFVSDLCG